MTKGRAAEIQPFSDAAGSLEEFFAPTRKFLLAEGWMLTSFYHQNPVTQTQSATGTPQHSRKTNAGVGEAMQKGQRGLNELH
jgi:hypothetical protein